MSACGTWACRESDLREDLSKGSSPIFMRVSEKTTENTERIGRQARIVPGISILPVLRAESFGSSWRNLSVFTQIHAQYTIKMSIKMHTLHQISIHWKIFHLSIVKKKNQISKRLWVFKDIIKIWSKSSKVKVYF